MGARTAAQRRVGEAVPGKAWMEPTTTYTVIHRLAERGVVKNENGFVSSLVSKDEAQAAELDELVEKTFEGSLPAFVAAFARKTKLSQNEVDQLRAMIDGYEEKRP